MFFIAQKISNFIRNSHQLRETTCRDWFRRFKSDDFDLSNEDRGKPPKKFEDSELQALLDEDSTQTLKRLAKALGVDQVTITRRLHAIGKSQKEGKWVLYELKERHWKAKNYLWIFVWHFKRKSFLLRIVTGDKKWIYFDNPKRKNSWVDPGQPSASQPVRDIHGKKVCCVFGGIRRELCTINC